MDTNRIGTKKKTLWTWALSILFAIVLVAGTGACQYSWGDIPDTETSKERLAELSAESAAANENAKDDEDIATPKPTTLSPQVQKKIESANTIDTVEGEKTTSAKPISDAEDANEAPAVSTASEDAADSEADTSDESTEEVAITEPKNEFTVATIGSTEYPTLQDAIAGAKNGDTIKLWIDSVDYITINDLTLTIDLNGHNIVKKDYNSAGTQSLVTINNSNVTFRGQGKISTAAVSTTYVSHVTINKVETTKLDTATSNTNQKYRTITAQNSNITIDGPEVLKDTTNYPLYEAVDKTYGGVIYVGNGDLTLKAGKVSGGPSSTTTSGITYGGGIAVKNGNFTMTGGEISGTGLYRSGTGYGGAVYVAGTSTNKKTVSITGGTMKNTFTASKNKAGQGGNLYTTYCDVTIGGTAQLLDGYASSGANVYTNYGSLTVEGGTISGGKATAMGGGVYTNYAPTIVSGGVISGNTVTGTAATNNGGGLNVASAQLTVTGGTIENNTIAGGSGAGISVTMPASSTLTLGGTIKDNVASNAASKGGGVYVKSANTTTIDIGDTTITGNKAAYGGGIAVDAGTSATSTYTTTINLSPDAKVYANIATDAQNKIDGTSKNKTDELLINYGSKVTYQTSKTKAVGFGDREITIGSTGYKFVEDKGIKGTGIVNATGYYCYEESKISKDDCIDAVVLDPRGNSEHYVWNEAENKAEVAVEGTGLYTSLGEAIEAAKNTENKTIIVCSETEVRNEDINGQGVEVKRCEQHHDFTALHLVGRVAISDVTIDGCELDAGSSPLIKADNGANLTINEGTIIKNARRSTPSGDFGGGAALEIAWGNGSSKLTINGGAFDNNRLAKGSGGAIYAWHTAITMKGGEFTNNYASYSGGAIAPIYDGTLDISGGTFDHNIAGSMGGAIGAFAVYTNDGVEGTTAGHGIKSTITGGTFTNNEAHESQYYAGGAIYNGRGCMLNLRNALVTGNYKNYASKGVDAAISNCSTGSIAIFKTQGALVTGNHSGSTLNGLNADIALEGSTGKTLAIVSDYALGGGDCNWTGKNGEEVPQSYYQNTNKTFSIVSHPSETTINEAKDKAAVVFTGNTATAQGTAIMNNGEMVIGANVKNVGVEKKWEGVDEDDVLPTVEVQLGKVTTDLFGNKRVEPMGTDFREDAIQTLSAENGWKYFWTDLPEEDEWVVVETEVNGYGSALSDPLETKSPDGNITVVNYTLTNTWANETTNISAEKFWVDNDNFYQLRPDNVEFQLTTSLGATDTDGNGEITVDEYVDVEGEVVKVTETQIDGEMRWRCEFADLQKYTKQGELIGYSVNEKPVSGYTSEISFVNDGDKWIDGDGNEWSAVNITNSLDFGSIKIVKSLEGNVYKDADNNGTSTAVFHVVGEWDGNKFYDNYIGVSFDAVEAGKVAAQIDGLLVGATYTITEVTFDGSGYVQTGSENTEFTLTKDMTIEQATASFTNSSDGEHPNQGLVNRFKFTAGKPAIDQEAA